MSIFIGVDMLKIQNVLPIAILCAACLGLLFPVPASAHAILLRSDPPQGAILKAAPQQVRMWFSEDLNPAFSTAVVLNQNKQRVDNRDAHVTPSDPREMDVTLQPNFLPTVYIVVWRTDSADDGHILTGSFIFYVARADGTVPALSPGSIPGEDAFGGSNSSGLYTGQLDGPTIFNLTMITLVELGAVFWVGAQFWLIFVLQRSTRAYEEQRALHERVQRRFERRLSLPTLLVLLFATIGVLLGQAINLTGGEWASAFSLPLLAELVSSGRFGLFWLMREFIIVLALLLAVFMLLYKQRSRQLNRTLSWANLVLGLALFLAIAMSSHASAVSSSLVGASIVADWLHLLAAALWVGGIIYIAVVYLPVLSRHSPVEQTRSLLSDLPYFSPLAVVGVGIMAITGPLGAKFHLDTWDQFLTTSYGRALVVKVLLVATLLLTSAFHVFLLRPRLRKEYQKYAYVEKRLRTEQTEEEPDGREKLITGQVKLRKGRLAKGTKRLTNILRWEALLGVAVLLCVGFMNVFAGTLSPIAAPLQKQIPAATARPFQATLITTDSKFAVTLNVDPKRLGPNVLTVSVVDNGTKTPITNIGVSLYVTMLDMDMGTGTVNLLPDGKGHFSATAYFGMQGTYQIRFQIRTPDNRLHETKVDLFMPL